MMIEIQDLKKSYGNNQVLKGVNLTIEKGSCTALVGNNGSGKSTIVDIITKSKKANSGQINYDFDEQKLFEHIGVQLQNADFDQRLKVKEIIRLWRDIYGEPDAEIARFIKILGIDEIMNQRSTKLSGGQKQKLSILLSVFHQPELLILDELTTGLDAATREDVREFIREYNNKGKTVFIVSHYMDEVEALCDYVHFLKEGVIFESGNPKALLVKHDVKNLQEFVRKNMRKEINHV
ncbi:ABC transporter ATP-binding protein [Lactococcus allomyrinae]|uniref:ABC transporter ATP-binding protein n=1 Tax=Lactococcus allomyrinae TaxID=2419773 RepID=A0A387BEM3_9LACT|nr:ABC transporter ATP-binding protein [Lactococcus allomyrinae]AYG00039.1 ABC transporter ATP-binding protein [Lactococcus allomyrinae]